MHHYENEGKVVVIQTCSIQQVKNRLENRAHIHPWQVHLFAVQYGIVNRHNMSRENLKNFGNKPIHSFLQVQWTSRIAAIVWHCSKNGPLAKLLLPK